MNLRLMRFNLNDLSDTAPSSDTRIHDDLRARHLYGKDREQVLYAGAKSEGKVTWYTSLAGDSYKGMVKAFETKYAGRQSRSLPRQRRAKSPHGWSKKPKPSGSIVDTIETTEANLMFQRDAFLLRPYHSPYFASYPEDAKQKGERGLYFWATARESYIGFAYNKNYCPRMPCRKTTKACSIRRSKAAWGSPSTTPAPKSSPRCSRPKDPNW